MIKIAVTGGAGFIGSNLVSFLISRDISLLVIDDFSTGKRVNLPEENNRFKIIKADVRNAKKMQSAIKGYDVVIHMAVQCVRKSINDPFFVHDVNASGVLSVLEASRNNKVQKFIYVSSSEVYGTAKTLSMSENHKLSPTTIYGASKLAGEFYTLAYLSLYGLPSIIVRPFNTYGYNSHFEGHYGEVIPRFVVRAMNNLPLQIFGDGSQTRDFTFVTDTVNGIWKVLKRGQIGEIYNIARGEEISILEIAKLLSSLLGKKLSVEYLLQRPGDVQRHYADIKRAEKEIGFKAKIKIEDGLSKYIAWFKRNIGSKQALKLYEEKNW